MNLRNEIMEWKEALQFGTAALALLLLCWAACGCAGPYAQPYTAEFAVVEPTPVTFTPEEVVELVEKKTTMVRFLEWFVPPVVAVLLTFALMAWLTRKGKS